MIILKELINSLQVSLWFMFLTFPIMVIKVNTIEKKIQWRFNNLVLVGYGSFVLSAMWRYLLKHKQTGRNDPERGFWVWLLLVPPSALIALLCKFGLSESEAAATWVYLGQSFFLVGSLVLAYEWIYLLKIDKRRTHVTCFWSWLPPTILAGIYCALYILDLVPDPLTHGISGMAFDGIGFALIAASALLPIYVRRYFLHYDPTATVPDKLPLTQRIINEPKIHIPLLVLIAVLVVLFPFVFSMYSTNIMITALIYVVLGLGLNIVVGLAGLLDLGYVAFYAVGAYSYALLNYHYGFGFWTVLPVGAALAAFFGILLGFPVLRLRGDYLAIVTLGFGEIIRLVLENWNAFSFGPSGIANIAKPTFFGTHLSFRATPILIYFIMIALTLITIFIVNRLQNSRIGRAWIALREDEIACQAMGIDRRKTKLTAFALGATWAGMAGVLFAAKTSFINPPSFTIWESIIILCVVVLGGMGSIIGIIMGALVLILMPEYLRVFAQYRLLMFGAILVLMMVFRPGGMISTVRRTYRFEKQP